jgi:hypothetical protein
VCRKEYSRNLRRGLDRPRRGARVKAARRCQVGRVGVPLPSLPGRTPGPCIPSCAVLAPYIRGYTNERTQRRN